MTERDDTNKSKRIQFIVPRKVSDLTARIINRVIPKFPDLKMGKAVIVRDHLVGAHNPIHSDERGIVILSPTFEDHGEFWKEVANEVKRNEETQGNVEGIQWLKRL